MVRPLLRPCPSQLQSTGIPPTYGILFFFTQEEEGEAHIQLERPLQRSSTQSSQIRLREEKGWETREVFLPSDLAFLNKEGKLADNKA